MKRYVAMASVLVAVIALYCFHRGVWAGADLYVLDPDGPAPHDMGWRCAYHSWHGDFTRPQRPFVIVPNGPSPIACPWLADRPGAPSAEPPRLAEPYTM